MFKPKVFVAELIGTFALVFIGAGTGALGVAGLTGTALVFGLVLAVFAYTYGYISGTHINPAVTFALALNGSIKWLEAVFYWIAEFAGGILGAAALYFVLGGAGSGLGATTLASGVSPLQGVAIETLTTFFLINTILHTAVAGKGKEFAGLSIGLTLAFAIMFSGPLTGGSLNPARTLGPAIFTGSWENIWVYFVGPLLVLPWLSCSSSS